MHVERLDTVGNVLQLTVVLLGPSTAVYATDILLRRNRYDGLGLGAGVAASAVCVDIAYTGPVAVALGGVDLALPAGLIVSSAVYALLMRRIHVSR